MSDGTPVMRFTEAAMEHLSELAVRQPELWLNPETDFLQVLRERDVGLIEEPTGITTLAPIRMPPPELEKRRQSVDRHAMAFLDNLPGITPKQMADGNLLAWLSCIHLLGFGITRWPPANYSDTRTWVKRRFLVKRGEDLTSGSVAGRNLWLAYISRMIAGEIPSLTEKRVLDHFAEQPEHYHQCMRFQVMRAPRVVGQYAGCLIQDAIGINRAGARELAREINRAAGARILDLLDKRELGYLAGESTDRIMHQPQYITNRKYLRGRKNLEVLSLGAGAQSSCMALMAEHGYEGMKKPDFAIFADTGWESPAVYAHLKWLESKLTFPVIRVSGGNIKDHILSGVNPKGNRFIDIPAYLVDENGKESIAIRQCTELYKIIPIRNYIREYLGLKHGEQSPKDQQVNMWIGLSTDEASRQKPSKEAWITNVYPLLDRDMSRAQLVRWFGEHYPGRQLPKSACIGCPYHNDHLWAEMKLKDPSSFQDAVSVDWALRNVPQCRGSLSATAYLHKSRKPLNEVDFSETQTATEMMQQECEGVCEI